MSTIRKILILLSLLVVIANSQTWYLVGGRILPANRFYTVDLRRGGLGTGFVVGYFNPASPDSGSLRFNIGELQYYNGASWQTLSYGGATTSFTKQQIDTVGTVASGVWQGSSIDTAYTNAVAHLTAKLPIVALRYNSKDFQISADTSTRFTGLTTDNDRIQDSLVHVASIATKKDKSDTTTATGYARNWDTPSLVESNTFSSGTTQSMDTLDVNVIKNADGDVTINDSLLVLGNFTVQTDSGGWRFYKETDKVGSIIGGYYGNTIGTGSTSSIIAIGGAYGFENTIGDSSFLSIIGGQYDNHIGNFSEASGILSGSHGTIGDSASHGTIVGGSTATISNEADYAVTVGGLRLTAGGKYSGAFAGSDNTASGLRAVNIGGASNNVTGDYSTNLGNLSSTISGSYSGGYGRRLNITGSGSFALADSENAALTVSENNKFSARFSAGYKLDGGGVEISGSLNNNHTGSVVYGARVTDLENQNSYFQSNVDGVADANGGAYMLLQSVTSAGGAMSDGTLHLVAYGMGTGSDANSILFKTRSGANATSEKWRISSAGNLLPFVDGTYDVGAFNKEVDSIYVEDVIVSNFASFNGTNSGTATIGAGDSVQVTITGITIATGQVQLTYNEPNSVTPTKFLRYKVWADGTLSIYGDAGLNATYWVHKK